METKTHTIDAEGKILGKLAVEVSLLLRGKDKVGYAPYKDMGDVVIIKNVEKMKFTGKKLAQKTYYRHSGYLGSLKETVLEDLLKKKPNEVLRKAVVGMLPKNKLSHKLINRLKFQ
ncbi:MAG: 50S ribosomal protein L13 [Candidatus Nealsonbacteria bacterium]